ncbi:MAG: SLC13 family permease [Firmicutes bacterium]|nr:SLC13 family permease [Bacillota bacterium]
MGIEVDQLFAWSVLLSVLLLIVWGRIRMEISALAGLLLLGTLQIAPPKVIFAGFGHPALATIIAVFLVSKGIINSGLLRGLGQMVAKRTDSVRSQIICIAAVGAFLSAFMNNVGAVGLLLPTTVRMAKRSGTSLSLFGLPLAMASILGGTITLVGSAPNIIIASYMAIYAGKSFNMFDFAPHGLAMIGSALLILFLTQAFSVKFGSKTTMSTANGVPAEMVDDDTDFVGKEFFTLVDNKRRITFLVIMIALFMVSIGWLHPAFGFGWAAIMLIFAGILKLPAAYASIDIGIIIFLGSMLGIGQTLDHIGALELLSTFIAQITRGFSIFWLIFILIIFASLLSNVINNSASAVFMAPLAVGIASSSNLEIAAALMAVAAGANLTLLLPTHQATLMVMSKAPFSTKTFLQVGSVLTLCCAFSAALVITLVWQ